MDLVVIEKCFPGNIVYLTVNTVIIPDIIPQKYKKQ